MNKHKYIKQKNVIRKLSEMYIALNDYVSYYDVTICSTTSLYVIVMTSWRRLMASRCVVAMTSL